LFAFCLAVKGSTNLYLDTCFVFELDAANNLKGKLNENYGKEMEGCERRKSKEQR